TVPEVTSRAYGIRVKREVAAPALALKREEELRGFGPLVNSLWAWVSPALFIWHLPISPVSPSSIYQHYKEGRRGATWNDLSFIAKTNQIITGGGPSMFSKFKSYIDPRTYDQKGNVKYVNPLMKDMVACPSCGTMVHRFTKCTNKGCRLSMQFKRSA
ncbi:hypothetical protein HZC08_01220, partial [Candidatus Micrarchaeota archaeon]|nr:hypothetical protein [Candidatus Micrarchaeota archaeon]